MKWFLFLFLFGISSATAWGQADSKICGVYQTTERGIGYQITLKPDHTFEYSLTSWCGVGDQFLSGTWSFDGKKQLQAKGDLLPLDFKATESVSGTNQAIVVKAVDENGATWTDVKIVGISNGNVFEVRNDNEGSCRIPPCRAFEITIGNRRGRYEIKDKAANQFILEIPSYSISWLIDDVWEIRGEDLWIRKSRAIDPSLVLTLNQADK